MRLRVRVLPLIAVAVAVVSLLALPLHADEAAPAPVPAEDPPAQERGIFKGAEIDAGAGVVFDLLVLRPLGLVGLAIGSALFVPAAALSAFDDDAFEECYELFVKAPYEQTITRPLGDF